MIWFPGCFDLITGLAPNRIKKLHFHNSHLFSLKITVGFSMIIARSFLIVETSYGRVISYSSDQLFFHETPSFFVTSSSVSHWVRKILSSGLWYLRGKTFRLSLTLSPWSLSVYFSVIFHAKPNHANKSFYIILCMFLSNDVFSINVILPSTFAFNQLQVFHDFYARLSITWESVRYKFWFLLKFVQRSAAIAILSKE